MHFDLKAFEGSGQKDTVCVFLIFLIKSLKPLFNTENQISGEDCVPLKTKL